MPSKRMVLSWFGDIHCRRKPQVRRPRSLIPVHDKLHIRHGMLKTLEAVLSATGCCCDLVTAFDFGPALEAHDTISQEELAEVVPLMVVCCVAVPVKKRS